MAWTQHFCRPASRGVGLPAVRAVTGAREATRAWTEATSRCGRGRDTHISKLGYYVLALVVSVEAVPGAKVFSSRYRLLVVGRVGAGIDV